MTAANILREKARKTENVSSAAFAPTSPDLLRAVAELMDACRKPILVQGSYRGDDEADMVDAEKCAACECIDYHATDCPLAALELLIAGEPAKIEGERDGA